jgi:SAM-dependent methyltransferase
VSIQLRFRHGDTRDLLVSEWASPARPEELDLLRGLTGPVLDLGCGPGRLVAALAEMGTPALGVDASPVAVESARRLGAPVLQRSLFEALPGEGRWRSVLLFDGNIGIGGDPVVLLRRLTALLGSDGTALVEVDPPGFPTLVADARIERVDEVTDWFPWACVGADDLDDVAADAGLRRSELRSVAGRWFGILEKAAGR